MSSDDWRLVLEWVSLAGFVFVGIYSWLINRTKATNTRLDRFEENTSKRVDRHADRLARLETTLKHMPTAEAINALHRDIGGLSTEVGKLTGEMQGIQRGLDTVVKELIGREKK